MNRGFAVALASFGGFAGGFIVPALLLSVVGYMNRVAAPTTPASTLDEILLLLYFVGVYALSSAVGYAAVTATSRNWRERIPRRAAAISVAVGIVAQVLNWTGLAIVALVPFMHILPRNVALALGTAMPGVLCGIAVALWSLRPPTKAPADPPPES